MGSCPQRVGVSSKPRAIQSAKYATSWGGLAKKDGAYLVAGTSAGDVWLWRVADRTPLLAVQGHTSPVYGVALSGDGLPLASGSEDGAAA
jgi:WD40 repeat protein